MNNLPTIDIKGKEYVMVKDRIIAFNELHPNGAIVTEGTKDGERIEFKAVVTPDVDKPNRFFTGHSQAVWGDGYINKTSALENAETSAVGRALAMMGIGIVDSIASADEINKALNSETEVKKLADKVGGTVVDTGKKCIECGNPTGNSYNKCKACHFKPKTTEEITPEQIPF